MTDGTSEKTEILPGAVVPGEALLRVRGLTRSFNGLHAVDHVAFDVAPGEVVSIIGPNGSGKTTTINLLTGILRADTGSALLDGAELLGRSPERINEAGLSRTFQNGRVFGRLSVRDNVLVGRYRSLPSLRPAAGLSHVFLARWASLLGELFRALVPTRRVRRELAEARESIEHEVARFGPRLAPRLEDWAYTLSYANRRRTEIARALVQAPRLLLLDEPTAGMNQTETAEVLEQLQALKADGQAILLVEHKIDLVMTLSDRVVVIDSGRVIAAGTPQQVQDDDRVVEAYLGRRRARAGHAETDAAGGER